MSNPYPCSIMFMERIIGELLPFLPPEYEVAEQTAASFPGSSILILGRRIGRFGDKRL